MEIMQARSALVKMIEGQTAKSVLSHVSLARFLLRQYKLCFLGLTFIYFQLLNSIDIRKTLEE